MSQFERLCVLSAFLLLPNAVAGGDTVYKSVDESGHVTYSAEPPADAATVEGVKLNAPPSDETTKEALQRAQDMEREADTRYDAMMEHRLREEAARNEAQAAARAAEEARRAEESSEDSDSEETDSIWYRRDWPRPHPPWPPHPPRPPHPPQPPHPPMPPLRGAH